jgi:hypothetical protein
MKALIAVSVLLAGCATRQMTDEERDQSDRTIKALEILKAYSDSRRGYVPPQAFQPVQPVQQQSRPVYVPPPPALPAIQPVPTVWILQKQLPINQSKICVYSSGLAERAVTVPIYAQCPPSP